MSATPAPTEQEPGLIKECGRHTPVWDHDGKDFRLLCGCGQFEHFGTDRTMAEQRFGAHLAVALAPVIAAAVARDRARDDVLAARVKALAEKWEDMADRPESQGRRMGPVMAVMYAVDELRALLADR